MIEAQFEFHGEISKALDVLRSLPDSLAPTYFSADEKIFDASNLVSNRSRFARFQQTSKSGFFLLSPGVTYNFRIGNGVPALCDCFLDVSQELALSFMKHMVAAKPFFGFACAPAEREKKNRLKAQFGINAVETWVGRDTRKAIPGFYWLTLLSQQLIENHGMSITAIASIALEHTELPDGQHLFRFFETPEDWERWSTTVDVELFPNLFNIEKVQSSAAAAKNFFEWNALLKKWK